MPLEMPRVETRHPRHRHRHHGPRRDTLDTLDSSGSSSSGDSDALDDGSDYDNGHASGDELCCAPLSSLTRPVEVGELGS